MESSDNETPIAPYAGQARAEGAITSLRQTRWRNVFSQSNMLVVAYASLVVVSMLALVLYVVDTPVYFSWFFTPCTNCSDERLTLAKVEAIFSPAIARRMMHYFAALPHHASAIAFPNLTEREHEILHLIAQGHNNGAIAKHLTLSLKTVRNHVSNIFSKLQVADPAQAIVRAHDAGLK